MLGPTVNHHAPVGASLFQRSLKVGNALGRHKPVIGTVLHQNAYFRPRGLSGRLYWYALLPFHAFIFGNMARRIAATAELRDQMRSETTPEPDGLE